MRQNLPALSSSGRSRGDWLSGWLIGGEIKLLATVTRNVLRDVGVHTVTHWLRFLSKTRTDDEHKHSTNARGALAHLAVKRQSLSFLSSTRVVVCRLPCISNCTDSTQSLFYLSKDRKRAGSKKRDKVCKSFEINKDRLPVTFGGARVA